MSRRAPRIWTILALAGCAAILGGSVVASAEPAGRVASRPPACRGWGRPRSPPTRAPRAARVRDPVRQRRRRWRPRPPTARDRLRVADRGRAAPRGRPAEPGRARRGIGLETLAIGPRGAAARRVLRAAFRPAAERPRPDARDAERARRRLRPALAYLEPLPGVAGELGRPSSPPPTSSCGCSWRRWPEARRYGCTWSRPNAGAVPADPRPRGGGRAARPGDAGRPRGVRADAGVAYDQTFVWGPRTSASPAGAVGNLIADNRKVPLTSFELALGFATGPATGAAAASQPASGRDPGTGARLGNRDEPAGVPVRADRAPVRGRRGDLHALPERISAPTCDPGRRKRWQVDGD